MADGKKAEKGKTLEDSFGELEIILEELDREGISLEESFDLYAKGMKLIKICSGKIEKVEKKLHIIGEEQEQTGDEK